MKSNRPGTLVPLGIAILALSLVLIALVLAPGPSSARCIPQLLDLSDGGGDEFPNDIAPPPEAAKPQSKIIGSSEANPAGAVPSGTVDPSLSGQKGPSGIKRSFSLEVTIMLRVFVINAVLPVKSL